MADPQTTLTEQLAEALDMLLNVATDKRTTEVDPIGWTGIGLS